MKNLLFISIVSILLLSCSNDSNNKNPNYIEGESTIINNFGISKNYYSIRYFKDTRTNLCFAEKGLNTSYSFSCVPCDSLVLLRIKISEEQ